MMFAFWAWGLFSQPKSRIRLRFHFPLWRASAVFPKAYCPVCWKEPDQEESLQALALLSSRQMLSPACELLKPVGLSEKMHSWRGVTWNISYGPCPCLSNSDNHDGSSMIKQSQPLDSMSSAPSGSTDCGLKIFDQKHAHPFFSCYSSLRNTV